MIRNFKLIKVLKVLKGGIYGLIQLQSFNTDT